MYWVLVFTENKAVGIAAEAMERKIGLAVPKEEKGLEDKPTKAKEKYRHMLS